MEIRPDLSICLLADGGSSELAPCLDALFACTDPLSLEVLVPAAAQCGPWHDSEHLHRLDLPQQPASAFIQAAWQQARGRYLGLWLSSVLAAPASLPMLVEFLDDHPDVAMAGPRVFDSQGAILPTAFQGRQLLPLADPLMPGWDGLATMEVDWLCGVALVINSLALDDVDLPTGSPGVWEHRLCRRLRRQGWHVFFVHLARVISQVALQPPPSFWQRLKDDWQGVLVTGGDR